MALQNSSIIEMKKFLNDVFYVPNYQREYSWTEENIQDFWIDLKRTVEIGENHFFGQMVIHNDTEHGKKYIIDGQQRTITSIIFLRSCQLLFKTLEDAGISSADYYRSEITISFIGQYSEDENRLKLSLGDADATFFREKIQTGAPNFENKPQKASHRRLLNAFSFFYNNLQKEMVINSTPQNQFDVLKKKPVKMLSYHGERGAEKKKKNKPPQKTKTHPSLPLLSFF